jgi:prepilin-type processing-associated H-X9-DG protein
VLTLRTSRLAVWSLVLGVLGLCVPLVGIPALILGIIGIVKARPEHGVGGRGMAIGGTALGAAGLIFGSLFFVMMLGMLLPGLGQARDTARQMMSGSKLRVLGVTLSVYAQDNAGSYPPVEGWAEVLIAGGILTPDNLVSPVGDGVGPDYFYLGGSDDASPDRIVAYEDPTHFDDGVNVLFADGRVEVVPHDEFEAMLAEQTGGNVDVDGPAGGTSGP